MLLSTCPPLFFLLQTTKPCPPSYTTKTSCSTPLHPTPQKKGETLTGWR